MSTKTTFYDTRREYYRKLQIEKNKKISEIIENCRPNNKELFLDMIHEDGDGQVLKFCAIHNSITREYHPKYNFINFSIKSIDSKDEKEIENLCNKVKEDYYKVYDNISDIEFKCEKITNIFGFFKGYNLVIKN